VMKQLNWPLIRSRIEFWRILAVGTAGLWHFAGRLFHVEQIVLPVGEIGNRFVSRLSFGLEKSIDRLKSRGGVPVFSRPSTRPISLSDAERLSAPNLQPVRQAAGSIHVHQTRRNVPVVMTTVFPR